MNQKRWKLNGKYQHLVYVDDENLWGDSIHAIKKSTETLLVASKEVSPDLSNDTTTCMFMSRDKNAGKITTNTGNNSFESVENSSIWENP